jgi:hypothetical protein
MKKLCIYIILGMGIASSCSKNEVSYVSTGSEEPMYKKDQKMEKYREMSGMKRKAPGYADPVSSGSSYASYAYGQEILNAIGRSRKTEVNPDSVGLWIAENERGWSMHSMFKDSVSAEVK